MSDRPCSSRASAKLLRWRALKLPVGSEKEFRRTRRSKYLPENHRGNCYWLGRCVVRFPSPLFTALSSLSDDRAVPGAEHCDVHDADMAARDRVRPRLRRTHAQNVAVSQSGVEPGQILAFNSWPSVHPMSVSWNDIGCTEGQLLEARIWPRSSPGGGQ